EVDGNGLVPMRSPGRLFVTARSFRRWLAENVEEHLVRSPSVDPLRALRLPAPPRLAPSIARRWPRASERLLGGDAPSLAALPLPTHTSVAPGARRGGSEAAHATLRDFVANKLERYARDRNHPDADVTSALSPYLHFGHVSPHEVLRAIAGGAPDRIRGFGEGAGAVLDQLVTWRAIGFDLCAHRRDHAEYASLPDWCRRTLDAHASDPRDVYSVEQLESARTHDELWNASQRQLLREGRIHNYLRMLWGKKILEWS